MRSWFTKDDRIAGVVEYTLTITLFAVAVIAGVLLVVTQLRGL
jgi:Flp pilus assembly pilin Flp